MPHIVHDEVTRTVYEIRQTQNEKKLEVHSIDEAIDRYQALVADMPAPRTVYAFDNRTVDFFDQLYLQTKPSYVLEVGFGHGTCAMQMLWQNPELKYHAIEIDPKFQPQLDLIKGWYGDRFTYTIADSQEYNITEDPLMSQYDLVILNSHYPDTNELSNDIQMAITCEAEWLFVDNLNKQTHRRALTFQEDENKQFNFVVKSAVTYNKHGFANGQAITNRIVGVLYQNNAARGY